MCLVFLLRDAPNGPEVLLGLKQRGFGTGRIVGVGGHVEPGESDPAAAVREAFEETGFRIDPADLADAGRVVFRFPADPASDMSVALYRATAWTGELTASDELDPQWFPVAAVPTSRMWDDSRIWLPHVLRGETIDADITYDATGSLVARVSLTVIPGW
ncbi:8-oxo-dGTP diphosphatase [Flexivirga caeni]|uniref:Oxidized purine nucleoside triphosphate hydrolase n=2 Tax=Flexivirga caeni TaxID=2294115 RepID=A0A3M9M2Z9_9MICO|nr:8-oxo-dGTP diphosphatase [Flexivirga caeni]